MPRLVVIVLSCLLAGVTSGAGQKTTATALSPDGQWEYVFEENIAGGIAKAGTTHILVDLAVNVPRPENSKVIWAPDSKRFAVTYSPPHVSHTTFETTAVYQLRGDKWEPLDPLVDEESSMPQVTQLAKDRSPKSRSERRMWKASPIRDTFKAREWLDANTLVIRAYAEWDRASGPSHAAFLFTFKFGAEGKWKLVKSEDITHKVEDAE